MRNETGRKKPNIKLKRMIQKSEFDVECEDEVQIY